MNYSKEQMDIYEANRAKKNQIKFRLNDEDYELFQKKLAESNLSITEFFRKLLIDGNIINYDFGQLTSCRKEMNKIGSNINQMAKRLNSTSDMFIEDVEEIRSYQAELNCLLTFRHEDKIAAEYISLFDKISDAVSLALLECDKQMEKENFNPKMVLFYLNYIKTLVKNKEEET